jgi:hypothetical protein
VLGLIVHGRSIESYLRLTVNVPLLAAANLLRIIVIIIIIIINIICHRFSFFPGTSLKPVVNPTTQASSLSLYVTLSL